MDTCACARSASQAASQRMSWVRARRACDSAVRLVEGRCASAQPSRCARALTRAPRRVCARSVPAASVWCACCHCYDECGLQNTLAAQCGWMCKVTPGDNDEDDEPEESPVPEPLGVPAPIQNRFCTGRIRPSRPVNPHVDGNGMICAKAVGKAYCTTDEELSSLYCARARARAHRSAAAPCHPHLRPCAVHACRCMLLLLHELPDEPHAQRAVHGVAAVSRAWAAGEPTATAGAGAAPRHAIS